MFVGLDWGRRSVNADRLEAMTLLCAIVMTLHGHCLKGRVSIVVNNISLYYQPAAHHQSDHLPLPPCGSHITLVYCNCVLMYTSHAAVTIVAKQRGSEQMPSVLSVPRMERERGCVSWQGVAM